MNATVGRDQFVAGLADGVRVLAIAGGFWFALAAWNAGGSALIWTTGPVVISVGFLILKSWKLRQTSSFTRDQARNAPRGSATWKIRVAFGIVGSTQTIAVIAVGSVCFALHRLDALWPWIGVIVSLHFIPLGWIFNLRAYYLVGLLGTVLSLAAILRLRGSATSIAVGVGLGLILTLCAIYILTRSESLVPIGTTEGQLGAEE